MNRVTRLAAVLAVSLISIPNNSAAAEVYYGYVWAAETVVGTLHAQPRLSDDSVDGETSGVVTGKYHLDRSHTETQLFDGPDKTIMLNVHLDFGTQLLNARLELCTPGGNSCQPKTGWQHICTPAQCICQDHLCP